MGWLDSQPAGGGMTIAAMQARIDADATMQAALAHALATIRYYGGLWKIFTGDNAAAKADLRAAAQAVRDRLAQLGIALPDDYHIDYQTRQIEKNEGFNWMAAAGVLAAPLVVGLVVAPALSGTAAAGAAGATGTAGATTATGATVTGGTVAAGATTSGAAAALKTWLPVAQAGVKTAIAVTRDPVPEPVIVSDDFGLGARADLSSPATLATLAALAIGVIILARR